MNRTGRFFSLLCGMAAVALAARSASAAVRVDLNPDNGRKDHLTPSWQNWTVKEGPTASEAFDGVRVTFRKAGDAGSGVTAVGWKGGVDYGVTVALDGVTVKDGDNGGQLEMVLTGLTPGRHAIVTYHNAVGDKPFAPFDVYVDGAATVRGVRPTHRVTDPYGATTAYVEVDAAAGKDVVLRFQPAGDGATDGAVRNVIVNGFALDVPDPTKQATRPVPADVDIHSAPDPALSWTPAKSAAGHMVYFGTDAAAVAGATPASPEFKGKMASPTFATKGLSSYVTYYWRVDEVQGGAPDAAVTKGEVWSFRPQHLAFPTAEGYGRFAIGGRGGRVIEVTNLDDAGPGSLRAACEAEGPRTVVFRVGGTIELKSKIIIRNPYITVAGQTAPGDGVCVKNYSFGCIGSHDVILRYLRVRIGDETGETLDGMGLASTDHAIVDHCSISWTIDESFSSRGAKNITFQRNLIAEALNVAGHKKYAAGKGHGFAASISGNVGSFHHNLLAHNAGRNWSLAGGLDQNNRLAGHLDIRNNVVYNWEHRTTDGGCRELNFVGNIYVPGPASRVFTLQKPDPTDPARGMRIFMTGNVMEGRPAVNADNWSAAVMDEPNFAKVRSDVPLFEPYVKTQPALEAYESVIADVGANLPRQDPVDARVIEDVRKRGSRFVGNKTGLPGIPDSQKDVGGWPEYKSGDAPPDGDHDGMPDAWEKARGLNPADPADGPADKDGDGYTNLEDYLNGIGR